MSGGLIDKVYIGLDNAPPAFDIKSRILGPNGTNLEYIRSETGVVAVLKGDKFEPLHLALHHARSEAITAAKSLALNLIETIKAELVQWSSAQAGGPPPTMNVPPPALTTTSAPQPVPAPTSVAMSAPSSLASSAPPTMMPPVVSVAPASTPLMTMRQPTVLQLLPQQQYVLNQENGQLIPIVQPGQVPNTLTSLPLAQSLGSFQQHNFGTQLVDLSSMQPMNVTQFRLSGVPSSMSMILPNSLIPQANLNSINSNDTTTVSSATSVPVVCAAPSTNSSQKVFYSTDKVGEKTDVKYQIQGSDGVQWTMPGSQTMLIPYQQLQDSSLANLQPQQFVSIAPAGGLPQTSLPLTAAQLQQLQASGTIMQINQKPITSSGSLINIISTGQASSPQILSTSSTPNKVNQDQRGQKRLSDGSPSQLQLRPIAPAVSHVSQDKSATRDSRSWTGGAVRDNNVISSMGMKINPAHGTIIHVSSGQQTSVSTSGIAQDGSGMYIRQIDRNAIQIQTSKDSQKQDITTNKIQTSAQNVQMITVPPGMTVLQNPLNLGQMPTMIGQPNSQVYMIPANQPNLVQSGLPPGLISQQMLQPGQNVTVMNPNQLQNSVQYNVPLMQMNMQPNQYVSTGLNLNTQFSAQQLNAALAGQQLTNNLSVSGTIPIVQAPTGSPMQQTIPISQSQQIQQLLPQNSFMTPTSQYSVPQYVMQPNTALTMQNNQSIQYSIQNTPQPQPNIGAPANTTDNEQPNSNNQNNYITSSSQENGFANQSLPNASQQTFANETSNPPTTVYTQTQSNPPNYTSPTNNAAQPVQYPTTQPPPYAANGTQPANPASYTQNVTQANYSPSPSPNSNQTYTSMSNVYPANYGGYNCGSGGAAPSRPWFRARYPPPAPYPPANPPAPQNGYQYWQDNS